MRARSRINTVFDPLELRHSVIDEYLDYYGQGDHHNFEGYPQLSGKGGSTCSITLNSFGIKVQPRVPVPSGAIPVQLIQFVSNLSCHPSSR